VSVAQELIARKQNKEKGSDKFNILSVAFLNGGLFPAAHRALFTQQLLANGIIGPYLFFFFLFFCFVIRFFYCDSFFLL
jgi:hypothetical protein